VRITLQTPLSDVITPKRRATSLRHFGLRTVSDLLTYYPFRVTSPVPRGTLRDAKVGQLIAVEAEVTQCRSVPFQGRHGQRVIAQIRDDDQAQAELVFFSHNRGYAGWMLARLTVGAHVIVCGQPSVYDGILQFTHPDIEVIGHDEPDVQTAFSKVTRPRPIYHATARFSSERIHESVLSVLEMIRQQDQLDRPHRENPGSSESSESSTVPTIIPESVRDQHHLLRRFEAFEAIHNPSTVQEFRDGVRTMRFEEAFVSQVSLLKTRHETQKKDAPACPRPADLTDDFTLASRPQSQFHARPHSHSLVGWLLKSLPFQLTDGQRRVCAQISADMAQSHPMQRLLQGEVGSGKTIVALIAMLQAVDAGYQAVLVAPTQVLASQHAENIRQRVQALEKKAQEGTQSASHSPHIPVYLLTGSLTTAQRRKVLAAVASGEPCITVATHAAFSDTFQAPRMALAIIDEQHRFGVEQRDVLVNKAEKTPHLLVMTATPIPRTAAMTWFGDLQVSELEGLPSGRKPVSTVIIPEADNRQMAQMFVFLRQRIDRGERAYVICPAIESSDNAAHEVMAEGVDYYRDQSSDEDFVEAQAGHTSTRHIDPSQPLHSVEGIYRRLSRLPQFQGIQLAHLTGRDDEATKNAVMAGFESGKTPLLVATTVIEVGVDVPQASCIVILNADHFGLTQLHQLRGRVGRGGTPGWAFLVSQADEGSLASQRLDVLARTTDGREISEADISLRGVGDVLGDAQSGNMSSFKILRVVQDANLISTARKDAQQIVDQDPSLSTWPQLAGSVLDFLRGNEKFLTRN
jgi:ATP-dependent DNA helicase RecG